MFVFARRACLAILVLFSAGLLGCGPCDTCDEWGSLVDACRETWEDDFAFVAACGSYESEWFSEEGILKVEFLEQYSENLHPCVQGEAAGDCRSRNQALEGAMSASAVEQRNEQCTEGNDGDVGAARRNLDCEGFLIAIGAAGGVGR